MYDIIKTCASRKSMKTYFITLLSILVVELTDKTRLVALVLSARYRTPIQLITGMTLGYVPAIAVAVFASEWISIYVPPLLLRWLTALSFIGLGAYLLAARGKREEDEDKHLKKFEHLGPFWIGFLLVMVTEFADKSQFATAGLALKYKDAPAVFLGSLSAQALLNIVYVAFGTLLGKYLPVKLVHLVAGILFLIFGIWVLCAR
ncbi:MAG: TMEM165/GDT1 family protein [Candidatus Omnitrophica bacterium]|nr:TMEM165/GDT1 family protein [Candidatus Omnitrophota bacterium]